MRIIGRGRAALTKFCAVMNMPGPVVKKPFQTHVKRWRLWLSFPSWCCKSKPYGEESGMCCTYPKENGRQVERKRKARNWQMRRQLVGASLTTWLTLSSDTMERLSAKSRVTYLAWRELLKLFRTTMPQLKTLHFMTSPEGPDSWCKWQCDQANGTNPLSPKNVAHAVMQEILPKF